MSGSLVARLGELAGLSLAAASAYTVTTVDLPAAAGDRWPEVVGLARTGLGLSFVDHLVAVDQTDRAERPGVDLTVRLWSVERREGIHLRTCATLPGLTVPSLTGVVPGLAWAEREVAEMYGVVFAGHPDPAPLLLPEGFAGHPLRKSFVLGARVVKPWPGALEPGESSADRPARRPARPPGVPEPGAWGP